jgi:hypothetical protein
MLRPAQALLRVKQRLLRVEALTGAGEKKSYVRLLRYPCRFLQELVSLAWLAGQHGLTPFLPENFQSNYVRYVLGNFQFVPIHRVRYFCPPYDDARDYEDPLPHLSRESAIGSPWVDPFDLQDIVS